MMQLVGYDMASEAARQVYERPGVGPEDIQVVELHDCFTTNELSQLRGARADPGGHRGEVHPRGRQHLRRPGGHQPVRRPAVQGPPARRDRLAQCAELVWQLRGEAGARQVDGVRIALQHNIGLGGAAVVTLYEKVG